MVLTLVSLVLLTWFVLRVLMVLKILRTATDLLWRRLRLTALLQSIIAGTLSSVVVTVVVGTAPL